MGILMLIFKEMLIIAGIIFLFLLILAMVTAPFKAYRQKKETEKAVNDLVNTLVDEIFKEKPKKSKKTVDK